MKISWNVAIPLTIVLAVFLCLGVGTVIPRGMVDFPCFVDYDETNRCIAAENSFPKPEAGKQIQVFFSTSQLGLLGGGCHVEASDQNLLVLETPVLKLKFERAGDALFVNGRELEPGGKFVFQKFWNPNPWTVYRIEFTNLGAVPLCGSDRSLQTFVIGSYGNEISLIKLAIALFICLAVTYKVAKRNKVNDSTSE